MTIEPGTRVIVRTANGKLLPKRAVSGVERGVDFPVIWVSREEEWEAAQGEEREPDAIPWPAEDVSANGDEDSPDPNEVAHRIVKDTERKAMAIRTDTMPEPPETRSGPRPLPHPR